jgi:hypothetical protein
VRTTPDMLVGSDAMSGMFGCAAVTLTQYPSIQLRARR